MDEAAKILDSHFGHVFEADLLLEMSQEGIIKEFPTEHVLIEAGFPITHIPLILSGAIRVLREEDNGRELLLYYLEFGETCAFTLTCCQEEAKSKVSAITEGASKILFIPTFLMDEWMTKYFSWRSFVLRSYQKRLDEMVSAIDNLAFNRMEERIFLYIKERASLSGQGMIGTTHAQIARDLNTSRVVVSRLLKKLSEQALITYDRNGIRLIPETSRM